MSEIDPDRIVDATTATLLNAIAAKSPVPGGGAVAGLTGAIGVALGTMVVAYSEGRRSLAEHADHLATVRTALEDARTRCLELAAEDARAYAALNALWRLPEDDPGRIAGMPDAVAAAIAAPRGLMDTGMDVLAVLESLIGRSNRHLGSDLAIAAILTDAAVRSAAWNVRINLPLLTDEAARAEAEGFVASRLKDAASVCREIEQAVAAGA